MNKNWAPKTTHWLNRCHLMDRFALSIRGTDSEMVNKYFKTALLYKLKLSQRLAKQVFQQMTIRRVDFHLLKKLWKMNLIQISWMLGCWCSHLEESKFANQNWVRRDLTKIAYLEIANWPMKRIRRMESSKILMKIKSKATCRVRKNKLLCQSQV